MAKDIDQLSVTLTAQIDQFQSNMRQAGQTFDREASQIEDRNRQLTTSLASQMSNAASSINILGGSIRGLAAGAVIGALVAGMDKAQESLISLGKQAEETRLSLDELAGLRLAAIGKGLGVEQLNKDLAFFTEQSKKTQDDARGLYKAFDLIGPSFRNAFANAATQGERLSILSKAMISAADATQREQLAQNGWNDSSDRAIAVIASMNGSIGTLVDRAKAYGITVDADLVRKSEDAAIKLKVFEEVITTHLIRALAELADTLRTSVGPAFAYISPFFENAAKEGAAIANAFNTVSTALGQWRGTGHIPMPQDVTMIAKYKQEDAEVERAEAAVFAPQGEARDLNVRKRFDPHADLQRKPTEAAENEYDREVNRLTKLGITLKGQAAAYAEVGAEASKVEAAERLKAAADEAGLTMTPKLAAEIEKLAATYGKLKSAAEAAKLAADIRFEFQQLGRSADEAAAFSRVRGAGLDPEKEGAALVGQMERLQNLTDAKEGANSFVKGLISDMENGVKAGKALENQLKRILEKLADKGIDKLISGAFGLGEGFFGGGRSIPTEAQGGYGPDLPVPSQSIGGWAGIGPRVMVPASAFRGARQFAAGGGIPAILHAGEIVLNQAQQKNVAQSMGGPKGNINLTHAPVINGTGLSKEEVFSVIQRSQKEFARHIGPIFSDWQRRYA
jgi:hypothetical protein